MAQSIVTRKRTRVPERSRFTSQRGTHPGGNTFVNAAVILAQAAGNDLTLTFDQPVTLSELPSILTDVAANPLSAVVDATGLIVTITYDAAIAAALFVFLPNNDDAIRTRTGGWPVSLQFPVTP